MQQGNVEFYREHTNKYADELNKLQEKLFRAAMIRLGIFILILIALYYSIISGISWIVVIPPTVVFILMIRYFFVLKAKKQLTGKLHYINENELAIAEGRNNQFDNGEKLQHSAIYAGDLDIAGPGSLYHFLNRTTTAEGSAALAHLLNYPLHSTSAISAQQQAVKSFSSQVDVRQMITARGLLRDSNEGDFTALERWIQAPGKMLHSTGLNIARFVFPVYTICSFFYYLSTDNLIPVTAGIAINWLFISYYLRYITLQHLMLGKKQSLLSQYASILEAFHQVDASSSDSLQSLKTIADSGRLEILRLSKLTSFFDQRLNMFANFLLNSFGMYDVHCMIALEKWKEKNRGQFRGWVTAVGEIEKLNCLANFAFNHPNYSYPLVDAGPPHIVAKNMWHPLIPEGEAVPNDFNGGINEKLLLVSGSNMSGKSTFLRTVGVNLLLAQCGAPVAASHFAFTPMEILSSIRINDSLQDHTSYFMAELKRLHAIILRLEEGAPALVLIDEVLRGTNSDDKTHGSEALIKQLIRFQCLALFATHDLSLSRLENDFPGSVSNYCFESRIVDGELMFDYKLNAGIAKNKNATFLMQKMGIIASE